MKSIRYAAVMLLINLASLNAMGDDYKKIISFDKYDLLTPAAEANREAIIKNIQSQLNDFASEAQQDIQKDITSMFTYDMQCLEDHAAHKYGEIDNVEDMRGVKGKLLVLRAFLNLEKRDIIYPLAVQDEMEKKHDLNSDLDFTTTPKFVSRYIKVKADQLTAKLAPIYKDEFLSSIDGINFMEYANIAYKESKQSEIAAFKAALTEYILDRAKPALRAQEAKNTAIMPPMCLLSPEMVKGIPEKNTGIMLQNTLQQLQSFTQMVATGAMPSVCEMREMVKRGITPQYILQELQKAGMNMREAELRMAQAQKQRALEATPQTATKAQTQETNNNNAPGGSKKRPISAVDDSDSDDSHHVMIESDDSDSDDDN